MTSAGFIRMTFFPDLITSLTTFCSPYLRHMGYLNEAIGMRARAHDRRTAWQPHLDNTRRFVLSSAFACAARDRAVVLGSGLLLDLPLAELSSLFREVVLMDVVCLPEARKEIRKYGNVSFVEHDATGIAELLYLNRHRGVRELPQLETGELPGSPPDFVVSLNILSQLWVVPRSYVIREFPGIEQDRIDAWCSAISAAHWRMLQEMPCPVCLIADHAFVTRGPEGTVHRRGSTIGDLSLPEPDDCWTWRIDPGNKRSDFVSRELLVGAWNWQGADALRGRSPDHATSGGPPSKH
jgi:hypothetical protein